MGTSANQQHILILFAHPALERSRVNKHLIRSVSDITNVAIHDLYETYPDFHIDVKYEQDLLIRHDLIVFHYPVFWFNLPALLKEWQDLVLVHGWAYGKAGKALKGKKLLSVLTTGGREALYRKNGYHRNTIADFLKPIEQMAYVCGMDYLPPFVVHGTHSLESEGIARHGQDYRALIIALRDNRVDFDRAREFPRLNSDLESIMKL